MLHDVHGGCVFCGGSYFLATQCHRASPLPHSTGYKCHQLLRVGRGKLDPAWWGNRKVLEESERQGVKAKRAALGKHSQLHCPGLTPGSNGLCELLKSLFLIFFHFKAARAQNSGVQQNPAWHPCNDLK